MQPEEPITTVRIWNTREKAIVAEVEVENDGKGRGAVRDSRRTRHRLADDLSFTKAEGAVTGKLFLICNPIDMIKQTDG